MSSLRGGAPLKLRLEPLALAFLLLASPVLAQGKDDDDDDDKPKKPASRKDDESAKKKKDPDALPEDPLERSRALLARGRHDEAQELARALAQRDAKALAPRKVLAEILLKTGR